MSLGHGLRFLNTGYMRFLSHVAHVISETVLVFPLVYGIWTSRCITSSALGNLGLNKRAGYPGHKGLAAVHLYH